MTRALAVAGAVLLIAAAVLARAVLRDGGDGDDGGDPSGLVIACIPELAAACEALDRPAELRIEDPADTIAAVESGIDIDAWVTLDPWPAIAAFESDDPLFASAEPVAVDDLALVVRATSVPSDCPAPPTWTCIQADDPDRAVLPRTDTASGLLATGLATADVFLTETGSAAFASQDLADGGPAGDFVDAYVFDDDPLLDMLQIGSAGPFATILRAGEANARIGGTREEPNLVVGPTATGATVAVVVAGPRADRLAGEPAFTAALVDAGWNPTPDAATTGLPNPGVLVALAQEVSR